MRAEPMDAEAKRSGAAHEQARCDALWRDRFGAASRRELSCALASALASAERDLPSVCARVEQRHIARYGVQALRAELADERERDAATTCDRKLVAYEAKWAARLSRWQRTRAERWTLYGLSPEELHAELSLRLIAELRSNPRDFEGYERAGREWGLTFLVRQRSVLRQQFRLKVALVEAPQWSTLQSQEDVLIAEESTRLLEIASERAEHALSRPQRRWLSALKLSANAGHFFDASGKPNLAAASRLLEKNRSSAQRAFAELHCRFDAERRKLEE